MKNVNLSEETERKHCGLLNSDLLVTVCFSLILSGSGLLTLSWQSVALVMCTVIPSYHAALVNRN